MRIEGFGNIYRTSEIAAIGSAFGMDPMEIRRMENEYKRAEAARQARIELYQNKVHSIAKEMNGQVTSYNRDGMGMSYDYHDFDKFV